MGQISELPARRPKPLKRILAKHHAKVRGATQRYGFKACPKVFVAKVLSFACLGVPLREAQMLLIKSDFRPCSQGLCAPVTPTYTA